MYIKRWTKPIHYLTYPKHFIPFIISVHFYYSSMFCLPFSVQKTPHLHPQAYKGHCLLHWAATSPRTTCSVPFSQIAVKESNWWFLQVVILSSTSLLIRRFLLDDFIFLCLFIFLDSQEYHSTSQVCSVTISWWKSTGFLEYFVCLLLSWGLRELGAMETDLYKYIHMKCALPKLSAT